MPGDKAALIQRAKQDDPTAFAEIYDQHQPAIYRYIYYRLGDTATTEDLTSQVFVRMVEKIDTFTYRGQSILAWLYTIARNLIIDHRRRAGQVTMLLQTAYSSLFARHLWPGSLAPQPVHSQANRQRHLWLAPIIGDRLDGCRRLWLAPPARHGQTARLEQAF